MVGRHPKAHFRMEDNHKCSQREGGQLPRVGLMATSPINCKGMTIGMGGGCAVLSSPRIILQLDDGIHYSAPSLCLFSLLRDLALVLLDFSGLQALSCCEREGNPSGDPPSTVMLSGRDACVIWRGLYL
jgi:hypothetical protein